LGSQEVKKIIPSNKGKNSFFIFDYFDLHKCKN
jgi:hypothetical protein